MNIENDPRFRGVKIETINAMKDKAAYGISLIEKIEDVELQYEIDAVIRELEAFNDRN